MINQTTILFSLILLVSFGCRNDRKFNDVKNLSEFKNTHFLPTLEHKISNDKNSIYCATLLLAWDEIRDEINSPLTISEENFDLYTLNNSSTFKNVLENGEFEASGDVDGDIIKVRAELNKSLPFEVKLESYHNKLIFEGQKVSSFGVNGYGEYQQLELIRIVYFKNNNNFILNLLPKDKNHEIILFKTEKSFNTIGDMSIEIEKLTQIGKSERKNEKSYWKYYLRPEDEIIIPKINFNIETNFPSLEGFLFSSGKQNYRIESAWQRTAFILDESGAEIESEAEIAVAADAIVEDEIPKPKKMIFDKKFLILLKRKDSKNPYFGLWTTNTELMIKE